MSRPIVNVLRPAAEAVSRRRIVDVVLPASEAKLPSTRAVKSALTKLEHQRGGIEWKRGKPAAAVISSMVVARPREYPGLVVTAHVLKSDRSKVYFELGPPKAPAGTSGLNPPRANAPARRYVGPVSVG